MMMPRGQELLQPVNPAFIVVSLLAALAINLLPLGRVVWLPDMVLLLLAFWGVHQPLRVGMGIAFVLGLCMDVHQSALLGQHALAYATLMLGTSLIHRRLAWLGLWEQALQMLPLLAGA
ncbi:MAG: rod shape-determining protein MreD, partial [Comamonadaceae bacterium]|nr:rod shape-determining protein MreD [Comamonadaceae bacterium]